MKLGDDFRRQPSLAGWSGPADRTDIDDRVFTCPCGVTYSPGDFNGAHGWEPCPMRGN